METTYNPAEIEKNWADYWESQQLFAPSGEGTPYSMVLPPPNVTGSLHMGHGFQQTLMDALVRYHRMLGNNTLWQGGTDHAGIATQMVVERQLAAVEQTRHDLGREAFIRRIWQWKEESGSTITGQIRRLGASIDWSRERFTMDERISRATVTAFNQLYNDGLIYRGKRLVNWDPKLNTAISDLEVENVEKDSSLWHIRYPLSNGEGHLVVATTRPETMLGDSAVAVHPDDERYQQLIGQTIKLPLTDREIPIIADDYVEREFGTGCVKITPAHDFNDYEVGKRHDLEMITVLTDDAHINDSAPKAYQGLERFKARKQIIADLEAADLIEKIEPHKIQAPIGKRSGVIVEPMLTDQWFISMQSLARPAIDAVNNGDLKFVPENWTKTYMQWLENIQDWCISRQLWWGHRIPAWYDDDNNIYVGLDENDVREQHKLGSDVNLRQDEDVLDTWFSSGLWPMATMGWPENTEDLHTFYPTNVLVTGFDIIFFWVARMVMFGLYFTKKVPFKEVYITGLIRDGQGQKMSKSKGNVLDPVDLIDGISLEDLVAKRTANLMLPKQKASIEKATRKEFPEGIPAFGTDALRFTYCALATNGRDINFDLGRTEGYRNFCNKLWNATRFVMMTCDKDADASADLSLADRWIQSRLQHTIAEVQRHFAQYRFDLMATVIYEFVWHEFCGWYLELSKVNTTQATQHTLLNILESILRLCHPIIPFITEELWQPVKNSINTTGSKLIEGDSIMTQAYPQTDESLINNAAESDVEWLQQVITAIRTVRSEMNISPAKQIPVILHQGTELDKKLSSELSEEIKTLAKVDELRWHEDGELPLAAMSLAGQLEIHIPLKGLIDLNDEIKRLDKEIAKLSKERDSARNKLANPGFVDKAPAAVVAKEQQRLQEIEDMLEALEAKRVKFQQAG